MVYIIIRLYHTLGPETGWVWLIRVGEVGYDWSGLVRSLEADILVWQKVKEGLFRTSYSPILPQTVNCLVEPDWQMNQNKLNHVFINQIQNSDLSLWRNSSCYRYTWKTYSSHFYKVIYLKLGWHDNVSSWHKNAYLFFLTEMCIWFINIS